MLSNKYYDIMNEDYYDISSNKQNNCIREK